MPRNCFISPRASCSSPFTRVCLIFRSSAFLRAAISSAARLMPSVVPFSEPLKESISVKQPTRIISGNVSGIQEKKTPAGVRRLRIITRPESGLRTCPRVIDSEEWCCYFPARCSYSSFCNFLLTREREGRVSSAAFSLLLQGKLFWGGLDFPFPDQALQVEGVQAHGKHARRSFICVSEFIDQLRSSRRNFVSHARERLGGFRW